MRPCKVAQSCKFLPVAVEVLWSTFNKLQAADHNTCCVCFQDVLTDLSADCETFTLEDVLENGLVHKVSKCFIVKSGTQDVPGGLSF